METPGAQGNQQQVQILLAIGGRYLVTGRTFK